MSIVLATHNAHKREELRTLTENAVDFLILPEDFPDIPETGLTLFENALIKARAVFDSLHQPALADDTGLNVEALGGAPGVFSARYAGESASYDDNCRKLLHELRDESNRLANFVTVICFVDSNGKEYYFEGIVDGIITAEPRGINGFGYDSIFEPLDGKGKTFAEMSVFEKNSLSHRSRAVRKFVSALPDL